MRYRIQHKTIYKYSKKVDLGPHIVRLRPAVHAKSKVLSYSLTVDPACQVKWQYDPWNNMIARLVFPSDKKASELSICVDAAIETTPINPFDFYVESWCENLPFQYPENVRRELTPFLEMPKEGKLFEAFLDKFPLEGSVVDFLVNLNSTVFETIEYTKREEAGLQSAEETLKKKSGSCRDTANLIMEVLRANGLAARFVSGYLLQEIEDPENSKEKMLNLDLHAWTEIYLAGAGWVGLDGTSGLLCGEGHIPLACTVTPQEAAPVTGTASEVNSDFIVESQVVPIGDEASPDKPYTEDDWRDILKVGDQVDSLLESFGVNLTSGGEPTFTASDLSNKPEWFTQALGESKWNRANQLFYKLYDCFGQGPLPIVGTGKLYPGETSPRWALSLLWRVDNEPIWLNKDLLHWPLQEGEKESKEDISNKDIAGFLEVLSKHLGVSPNMIPGYEDPLQLALQEGNLPLEEEVEKVSTSANLKIEAERKKLVGIVEKNIGDAIGYALPLTKLKGEWYSNKWVFKRDNMYLLSGDSPMGLRLPLDRIKSKIESDFLKDPSVLAKELPKRKSAESKSTDRNGDKQDSAYEEEKDNTHSPVTALCVQARGEGLGIFIPPLTSLDDYLELIEAIEEAAATTSIKVQIEGYGPPPDSRIKSLSLTPDPGVLEANMPVADTVREYNRTLEIIGDAAIACKLGTEKYQLDGRIVGTGGGHHITLGGPNTLESPFIKHPHILASMIRYFQNHPALSFFFTGLFVGPHSQAPRIDEARLESLYELELALSQFPNPQDESPPWLTDRLLRNILVDMTGNTHRAEICIDKLYNPDSQTGRLGLVELRAFEMPLSYSMAVTQVLLIRALVARFLVEPYKEKLINWGERLHDQYMLPYYLWSDLGDIIRDLNSRDILLKKEWFKPFLDFRFPRLGTMTKEDVQLELRVAHEPWHVLSVHDEESTVSRPVDSSMERIQVKVHNLNPRRHKVIVNGVEIPLTETGISGDYIGAVRFRAWRPPNCMHPNIEIHHPLKFEIVDFWSKRSLGSCQYHVVHPEGKLYEEAPITRSDAQARVHRRFTIGNHSPWPVQYQSVEESSTVSLDLRLFGNLEEVSS